MDDEESHWFVGLNIPNSTTYRRDVRYDGSTDTANACIYGGNGEEGCLKRVYAQRRESFRFRFP